MELTFCHTCQSLILLLYTDPCCERFHHILSVWSTLHCNDIIIKTRDISEPVDVIVSINFQHCYYSYPRHNVTRYDDIRGYIKTSVKM